MYECMGSLTARDENVYFTDGRYVLIFRNKYKTMGGLMLVCILHRMLRRT